MKQQNATTLNLSMLAEHNARQRPQKTAVVCGEHRLTFKQLNDYANKIANALRSLGLQAGDHVALSCPNLPYFPMVYYGILKAGCVVVPLNILFKPRDIAYHLQDSDAKAVFVFEGTPELPLAQIVKAGFDETPTCEHFVVIQNNPMIATSSIENAQTLTGLILNASDKFETHPTAPDDTAVILYTSGTTGRPKGAELTHLNMMMNANVSRDLFTAMLENNTVTAENRILITLPLFHSTGQTCQMNAAMYGGITSVLLPRFDPKNVIETMKKERINLWTAVPTMFWALIKYVEENDIDVSVIKENLKVCSSGGAPIPVEVLKKFEETFGVKVLEGYGLSETAPVSCFNQPQLPQKAGTVGTPLFNVEIKCFDENDVEVPVGSRGEVVMRGHNVMKGYYKKPVETAEALRNGWFHSGDIGIFDEDGYLSIVDRKKDMILRGGYNVYPRELEETIITHPEVSLVAVIGVIDERLGEEVKAFIVRKQNATVTESEMLEWFKENIASNKYPRYIEFREELPISATGKILKRELPKTV